MPRPSHPATNVRDDRDTPLDQARDGGITAADLPDDTSADTCDKLTRRAICAWLGVSSRMCDFYPHGEEREAPCPDDASHRPENHEARAVASPFETRRKRRSSG